MQQRIKWNLLHERWLFVLQEDFDPCLKLTFQMSRNILACAAHSLGAFITKQYWEICNSSEKGRSTFQSFEKPIRCQINVKLLPEMRISRICCNQKIFSVMQHRNVELQKKINIYIYLVQIAVQADTYRCASMSLVSCCWCTFHVSPSLSSHKHLLPTPSPFWALPLALFYNLMFGCSDIWT